MCDACRPSRAGWSESTPDSATTGSRDRLAGVRYLQGTAVALCARASTEHSGSVSFMPGSAHVYSRSTEQMSRTATSAIVLAMGLLSSTELIRGGAFSVSAQEAREAPRFRVAVDAVRIDAVVTDRNGRTVDDLTADDFEVRQDGKLQKVPFAEFMPVLA